MIERGPGLGSLRAGIESALKSSVTLPEIECHAIGAAREALWSLRRFVEDGLKMAERAALTLDQGSQKSELEKVAELGVTLAIRQTIEQGFTLLRDILSREPERVVAALKESWNEVYSPKSNDQLFSDKVLEAALKITPGVSEEHYKSVMQNIPGLQASAKACSELMEGTTTGSCLAPAVSAFGLVRNSAVIAGHVIDFSNNSARNVLLMGRSGCPVTIQSPWCSAKHMELVIRERTLHLDHLNSTCGTDVAQREGEVISIPKNDSTSLSAGDMVIIAPLRGESEKLKMAAAIFMILPGTRIADAKRAAAETKPAVSNELVVTGRAIGRRLESMTRIGINAAPFVVGPAGSEINAMTPERNYNELTGAVSFEYLRERACWAVRANKYSGSDILATDISGTPIDLSKSLLKGVELNVGDKVLIPTKSGEYLTIYMPPPNMQGQKRTS